ncbi:MAG: hypothetical protein KatS3mg122_1109 [Caldimonas sp.]|nr:MAG: hypothetical protein KatS3mg122_1109 [Caldimonas sp.]
MTGPRARTAPPGSSGVGLVSSKVLVHHAGRLAHALGDAHDGAQREAQRLAAGRPASGLKAGSCSTATRRKLWQRIKAAVIRLQRPGPRPQRGRDRIPQRQHLAFAQGGARQVRNLGLLPPGCAAARGCSGRCRTRCWACAVLEPLRCRANAGLCPGTRADVTSGSVQPILRRLAVNRARPCKGLDAAAAVGARCCAFASPCRAPHPVSRVTEHARTHPARP